MEHGWRVGLTCRHLDTREVELGRGGLRAGGGGSWARDEPTWPKQLVFLFFCLLLISFLFHFLNHISDFYFEFNFQFGFKVHSQNA